MKAGISKTNINFILKYLLKEYIWLFLKGEKYSCFILIDNTLTYKIRYNSSSSFTFWICMQLYSR